MKKNKSRLIVLGGIYGISIFALIAIPVFYLLVGHGILTLKLTCDNYENDFKEYYLYNRHTKGTESSLWGATYYDADENRILDSEVFYSPGNGCIGAAKINTNITIPELKNNFEEITYESIIINIFKGETLYYTKNTGTLLTINNDEKFNSIVKTLKHDNDGIIYDGEDPKITMELDQYIRLSDILKISYIIIGIGSLFSIVYLWRIFEKLGRKGRESIIPIRNLFILCKVFGKKWLFGCIISPLIIMLGNILITRISANSSMLMVGIVNLIVWFTFFATCILGIISTIVLCIQFAKKFKKSNWFGIGILTLTPIFLRIIAPKKEHTNKK